jgi:stage V sporulation protein G
MQITDVKISLREKDERLKAFATVTLDGCFVIRGLRIINGASKLFVAMPARLKSDGTYQDIAHPIDVEARQMFERVVLAEYFRVSGDAAGA